MKTNPESPIEPEHARSGGFRRGLTYLRVHILPHRGNRGLYFTGLTLVLLGTFSIFNVINYIGSDSNILPKIKQHGDVPYQPKYTFNQSLTQKLPANRVEEPASSCRPLTKDWLRIENENPGIELTSKDWKSIDLFTSGGSALWLNKESGTCGETIQIHASLTARYRSDEGPRTFRVMRVGYYGGSGARELWQSAPTNLVYRNIPNVRTLTRTVETRWPTTTTFTIGKQWVPGLYLVASVSPKGVIENWSPFILRSPKNSSNLVLVHSTLTWQAYNNFGGRSAYTAPERAIEERSKVLSFDRPYSGSGMNHLNRDAVSLVQFLESENIEVDQLSDIDLSLSPSLSTGYSGLILSGHPEYMTHNQFATILAARNSGTNLAILGANSAFWQVRLERSPIGSNRRFAIYRDAKIDPQTAPDKLTVEFGDPRINWQPSLITGEKTAGVHVYGDMSMVEKPRWLKVPDVVELNGWPANSEIDSQAFGKTSPPNQHLFLSGQFKLEHPHSRGALVRSRTLKAQSIWFTLPSGSAEFVAGQNYWPCELSGFCFDAGLSQESRDLLRSITSQILHVWEHKAVGPMIDPTAYRSARK